jgi:Tfp pilus assembly protein PilF
MNVQIKKVMYSIFALAAILVTSSSLLAQAPGSSRGLASGEGVHTIMGRVYFPSGQSVDFRQVKVTLESVSAFGSKTTVTDADGSFRFTSLTAGGYTVVVDAGKEFEIARENASIDREASPGGRVIQLSVQLRLKIDSSNPAFANVTPKALSAYEKGVAATKKNDSKAATQAFEEAVADYPNFPIALNELGVQYMKLGKMDKAASTFEALIKLKPSESTAHLNLGIALYNLKKFEDAENSLRRSLELHDAGPTAHYYLGVVLINQRKIDDAQKEFELAVKNGGENLALAHRYLGGIYMSAKKNQEAADELEKYLKLDPKAPDAERIKGTIKELRSQK